MKNLSKFIAGYLLRTLSFSGLSLVEAEKVANTFYSTFGGFPEYVPENTLDNLSIILCKLQDANFEFLTDESYFTVLQYMKAIQTELKKDSDRIENETLNKYGTIQPF